MAQDVVKAPIERTVPCLTRREGLSLIINSDPLGIPLRLARKYGDVFFMEAGGQKVFFLNHPDDVRELLVVQHEKFYDESRKSLLERGQKTLEALKMLHAQEDEREDR
jgi:cytochrome P450